MYSVQLLVDRGKFLQAFLKVKVTQGSTVEEGGCEPGLKVDKDDEEPDIFSSFFFLYHGRL